MKKSLRWRVAQLCEARWWKLYLANKNVEDYLHEKKSYWRRLLAEIDSSIGLSAGQNVLDAGCGPAGIFMVLENQNVTAFDPLLDRYEETLLHFKRSMYPQVNFYNSTLEGFNSNKSYDVVFCMNAINHVSELKKAFITLYNTTRKGGRIVVTIDAHNHSFFKHLFRLQPADLLHPHQYDLEEYKEMLTSLGCEIAQIMPLKKEFFFTHYSLVAIKN